MFKKLILFFLLVHGLDAQQTLFRKVFDTKSDTHVEATALFSGISLGGYLPVRVFITNNQKIPHKIFLDFNSSNSYSESLSAYSEFSFQALPGRTVTHDILVPLSPQNGAGNFDSLSVDLSGTMGKDTGSMASVFSTNQPAVLLSDSLYTVNGSTLNSEYRTKSSGRGSGSNNDFAGNFSPKQLPDDWRAFSGYDTLMLSEEDWTKVPPGPRNAIISWLRLGGQLVIFSPGRADSKSLGLPQDPSFGQILIKPLTADLRLDAESTVKIPKTERISKTRIEAVTKDYRSNWPIQKAFGEKSFRYIFFILILLAFGILVAPINLFVFAKSGQRHRLFITTPLISLGTSLLLIALIIFQDGFGGDGTRLVLMEVRPDDNQNAAFVHQEQFSRTGVVTSPGFTVNASALIAPVPLGQSRWARLTDSYQSSGAYNLQPANGKIFARGEWFQSRSEQGQVLSAVVPTRGRIEAAGANSLISTFDFPIKTLLYLASDGTWYRAENLTKGQAISLTEIDPTMVRPLINQTGLQFTARNQSFFNNVSERRDHYIALTTSAPAIETHTGIEWKTQTVITGPIAR